MGLWRFIFGPPASERILAAMQMYGRPVTGLEISRAAGVNIGIVYAELYHLEEDGKVTGHFIPGRYPRRRVYEVK